MSGAFLVDVSIVGPVVYGGLYLVVVLILSTLSPPSSATVLVWKRVRFVLLLLSS